MMDFDASLETLVQSWSERALEAPALQLRMPLSVYLEEANELAQLMDRHLDPLSEQGRDYPGIGPVLDERTLTWDTPAEIRQIVSVVSSLQARAHTQGALHHPPSLSQIRRERAAWMHALRYLFEQQNNEGGQAQLKVLRQSFKAQSRQATSASLLDVLNLAEQHIEALKRLGFDEGRLGYARHLPEQLNQTATAHQNARTVQSQQLDARNRLLSLLDERVQAVRRAFRFVFRDYPEVLESTQSRYARQRRAKHAESRAKR